MFKLKYFHYLIWIFINVNNILSIDVPSIAEEAFGEPAHFLYRNDENLTTICEPTKSSIDDFPKDIFTEYQRAHGALLIHLCGAIYFFTLLAVVCNDYFIPSVECICKDLNISKDVAAATFMATATTVPELFTNVISTFIAESDMGLGTIIGSLTFNTLGVAAIAGLAAADPVQLDWWPLTRDCLIYSINISFLTAFAWDGKITLVESIIMVVLYFFYYIIIFQNSYIKPMVKNLIETKLNCCIWRNNYDLTSINSSDSGPHNNNINIIESYKQINNIYVISTPATTVFDDKYITTNVNNNAINNNKNNNNNCVNMNKKYNNDLISFGHASNTQRTHNKSLWRIPTESTLKRFWWFYIWPIKLLLTLTMPNPKTWRKLYPLTFCLCIIYIGLNSYIIIWMITVMGYTLSIPESVMGLTFLAAGGCLPEAISSIIMIRKGESGAGVSNSLGTNSLSILLSLGVPWLIKNIINFNDPEQSSIILHSYRIELTILSLIFATSFLYIVIALARYQLKRLVGIILSLCYFTFITIGILLELDIIFPKIC